jgi:cell division septation protein DedD
LQKPALAIQDLTQALWIKGGLTDTDRAEALRQRSAAYADAGVGDSNVAAAPRGPSGERIASNDAVTTGSNTSAPSASSNSGSGWNLFGNLFGGGSPSSKAAPPAEKPAAAPPKAAVSGWSSSTEVRPTSVAMAPQPAAAPSEPAAAPRQDGKFRVQLGLVRSESEAASIASRVGGEFASVFESRRASVDQTVVGNMGTMYRVRVGPYATANEGQAVCERLKGSRLDCLVVTQ